MKPLFTYSRYECISTFIDNLIVVAKQPLLYLETLASKFNLRNITDSSKFFLSANWTNVNDNSRISSETYIKEYIRKYQQEYGLLREENVPSLTKNNSLSHSELDKLSLLDNDHIKQYQLIIGTCYWIHSLGHLDITFTLLSLL